MSHDEFNLNKHSIDDCTGRILTVHGVKYIVHDLADEGGETFIFPLENITSGLIMFLAKVYKFKPGSPEFEERKRVAFNGFLLNMIKIRTAHEEQYEIPGGLMKFQLHQEGMFFHSHYIRDATPMPVTSRSYHELIEHASSLKGIWQRQDAIKVLQGVLSSNAEHSLALLMLGRLYLKIGWPKKVLHLVEKAFCIERNDVRFYHLAARSYVALGEPQQAIAILDAGLRRYAWEWESWELKREVATRFALTDVLREMAEDAQKRLDAFGHVGNNEVVRAAMSEDFRLRLELTSSFYDETDRAKDLTQALELFMEILLTDDSEKRNQMQFPNGLEAVALASKWLDSWFGRVVAYLANMFFLYEITAAFEVYGDVENLVKIMEPDSVESCCLKGYSSIFVGKSKEALCSFRTAKEIDPTDSYVQFGLLLALESGEGSSEEVLRVISELRSTHQDHPLRSLVARYFRAG